MGTRGYYAPEFITSPFPPRYTNKVDVWSFGCIIFEMATGEKTFTDEGQIREFATKNASFPRQRFPFAGQSANFLFALIQGLLTVEAKKRPKPASIVQTLREYIFNDPLQYVPMAYCLEDKDWLTIPDGNVLHVQLVSYGTTGEIHKVRRLVIMTHPFRSAKQVLWRRWVS